METSIFFARLIGIYLIFVTLSMLLRHQTMKTAIVDSAKNPTFILISGAISVLFGLVVVLLHNVWVLAWPVLITILGYLTILRGLIRLFCTHWAQVMIERFVKNNVAYHVITIILLIIGLILTYFGFVVG